MRRYDDGAGGPTQEEGVPLPKISIVTPSLNQAQFLEQTISSVLSQDYRNLEYIIIDGGSTDGSVDIIQKFADRLSYWVSEPDSGHADAINKGFARSSGEIIAWLNSDDVYLPGAVTSAVEAFQKHPSADLIYGDVYIIDEHDNPLGERRLTPMDRFDFLGNGNCLAQPATFWTRKIYDQVGGIDTKYYFQLDLDFYIKVADAGKIKHIRNHFAKMRMQPEGKMTKADDVRKSDLVLLRERYIHERGLGRLRYSKRFLLPRMFLRYAIQGDLLFASKKTWRRIRDRDLFRDSRS